MELPKNNTPVTTVGSMANSTFSIAMNAKAFRVLSDTLYQNKIGSIVREISCNALDGHIANGNADVPFTIHVPDSFEPWFSVRDYGIGLTPEAMVDVFTKYFESTKDQSNDSIGAFGLGAKTPFSYTDQFNVTSVTGGILRAYSAFIDEGGMPTISLMAEVPSDEPSGVEIKIGVKPNDFARFRSEISEQLRFFVVKPEILNWNGGSLFTEISSDNIHFQNDDIAIFTNRQYGYGSSPVHLVQGPVGYPLDFNQASKGLSEKNRQFMQVINNLGANLFFNIGEIGVTASREGVEYNDFTLKNLEAKVTAARESVQKWMADSVKQFKTPYEKAMFLNAHKVFSSFIESANLNISPAKLRNNQYSFDYLDDDIFTEEVTTTDYSGKEIKRDVLMFDAVRYSHSYRADDSIGSSRIEPGYTHFVPQKGVKVVFCIRDSAKAPVARMRHYFRENNLESLICIAARTDAVFTDDMIAKLKEELGGYGEIVRVSDMPEAPRQSYSRGSYVRPRAYLWQKNMNMTSTSDWSRLYGSNLDELVDADDNEYEGTFLYVVAERQQVYLDYMVQTRFNALHKAGMVPYPLIAVRPTDVDKLDNNDQTWIKLETFVEEKIEELRKTVDVRRASILAAIVDTVDYSIGDRFDSVMDDLHPETDLARLIRVRNRAKERMGDSARVKEVMNIIKDNTFNVDQHIVYKMVKARASEVFSKTPLVSGLRYDYNVLPDDDDARKHVIDYINTFGRRTNKPIGEDAVGL